MRSGYTRTEAGCVPIRRMYPVLRSLRLSDIDKIRERLWIAQAGMADNAGAAAIERLLTRQETALGRRLPSAADQVKRADLYKIEMARREARERYERNTGKRRNDGHAPQPGESAGTGGAEAADHSEDGGR